MYVCMYLFMYIHTYIHTSIHTYIHTYIQCTYLHPYMYIIHIHPYICTCILGLGTKVAKEHLKSAKTNEYSKFTHVFINVALTLRIPPKLDYCFKTNTSLVPVAVLASLALELALSFLP